MPDDLTLRMLTMEELKNYAIRTFGVKLPPADSAAALLEIARAFDASEIEAKLGVRFEPAYPGRHSLPQELAPATWHTICACDLYYGPRHVAVVFTTLIGGKPFGIYANGPSEQNKIPADYKALR